MPGVNAEITHQFVSAKADGPDATLVRPSNWNAQLNLAAGSGGHRLIRDPSQARGAAWVEPATVRLTNRTGGAHTVGDVVVLDSANDSSVAASASLNSLKKAYVALEANANAVAGIYAESGVVSAKATGAIARYQYVRLSATTGSVEDAGAAMTTGVPAPLGAVGVALAAAVVGLVTIYLFPSTVGGPPVTAGYIKGTGSAYATQATPLPAADLGSGSTGGGALFLADNQTWTSPSTILDRVPTNTTVSGTAAETTIYTKSIPGNTLASNKRLRLVLLGQYGIGGATGGLVNITFRVRWAGVQYNILVVQVSDGSNVVGIGSPFKLEVDLSGDGATNTQYIFSTLHGSRAVGGVVETKTFMDRNVSTVDSTSAQTLLVSVQHSTTDPTLTLEHALLEVL